MAELADALDSGSSVRKGRGGSNPLLGIFKKDSEQIRSESFFYAHDTKNTPGRVKLDQGYCRLVCLFYVMS